MKKQATTSIKEGLTRRHFIKRGTGAVLAAGCLSIRAAKTPALDLIANPTGGLNSYICPPCGQACDKLTFDKPGTCPQCGMKLVPLSGGEDSPPTVSVLLFDSVEIIDFAGPWEVFGAAGYHVFSVAENRDPVTTVYGQKITADYGFENSLKANVLLVPGGGIRDSVANPKLIKWVQDNAKESTYVMSVCTGAFILAKAGLLDGLSATTVRGGIERLPVSGKNIKAVHDQRYVDNGKIITTAGLSSGIDGALYLVSKMFGKGRAQQTALGLEYKWDPDAKFARAAYADRYLPDFQELDGRIISTDGDTEHWEVEAIIIKPASLPEIMQLAQRQIASNTPHARSSVTVTPAAPRNPDRSEISWKFTDDEGRDWQGSAVCEASKDEKGKFNLKVRLARSGYY
jgi:putative intracellular protease/amidase